MTNIGNLLTSGAKVLKLEKEFQVLQAIDAVARRWAALEPSLDEFDELIDFLEAVDDEIGKKDVKDAFKALGLDNELAALTRHRKRISSVFEDIGISQPERLIQSISSHPETAHTGNNGVSSWSLINKGNPDTSVQAEKSIDYDFDLGGRASIEFEGGALWPYSLDTVRTGMVRMGVNGKLAAKGEAILPFSLGSAGASFSADGTTRLDYYFEPADQSVSLAGAVAARLLHVPNPFSIEAVRAAMKTSGDFFGYDMELGGGISADMQVNVGKAFKIAAVGEAEIGLSFKATLVRRRDFQISLWRIGPVGERHPDMQLVVTGQTKKLDKKQLGIKISLEFGKLADHIHDQLEPLVEEWDDALKTIKPYLKPGTYLQQKVDSALPGVVDRLLGKSPIAAAIKADMRLLIGTRDSKKAELTHFLSKEIQGALNGLVSTVIGDVNKQAELLLTSLKKRLPLFETLDEDNTVLAELKKLTKELSDDFKKEAEKITKKKADRIKIAETLSRAGVNVNRVTGSADGALTGVRKLLSEYDATIKKAMTKLTEAANRKVSLSVTYATMRSSDTTYEINARLPFHTLQEDYNALLSGNFAEISKLILQSPPVITFGEEGNIKRIVTHQRSFGGSFVGFGIEADFSTVFTGKASIEVDHRGTVTILSEGQAKDVSTTFFGDKEKTEATFFDTISLSRAKNAEEGEDQADVLDLGLNLRRTDKAGLKPGELDDLLSDLKRYELITQEGAAEVEATVGQWISAGSGRPIPAVIDVALPLTGAQIMQVLRAEPKQTVMDAVQAQIANATGGEDRKEKDFEIGIAGARSLLRLRNADDITVLHELARKEWSKRKAESEANGPRGLKESRSAARFVALNERARAAWQLVELGLEMRELWGILSTAATKPDNWDFHDFADAQKRIAGKSKSWLATGQFLLAFGTDGVDKQMAAFFIALGNMAGLSDEDVRKAVTLSIQHTEEVDQLIVVR